MDTCKIYIYKSQFSRFKFIKLISDTINFNEFRHNKYYSTAILENGKCSITIYESSISINFYADGCFNVAYDIKNKLIETLNAEKLCFEFQNNTEWFELKNYKPKLINRIRYKLVNWLKD